jgi:hypothetical protein
MLVEVARAPNHQNPDREVNCQRQEDFHYVVSHPVCGQSRVPQAHLWTTKSTIAAKARDGK